jgi:hypothetical protein
MRVFSILNFSSGTLHALFSISMLGGFSAAFSAEQERKASAVPSEAKSPAVTGPTFRRSSQLLYDLDMSLLYLDNVKKLSRPAMATPSATESETQQSDRTFGMHAFKLGLQWKNQKQFSFRSVLRPDAVKSGQNKVYEADTRSGIKFSQAPTIELLDIYQVSFDRDNTNLTVGVLESGFPFPMQVYEPLIAFSHAAQPMAKAFGGQFVSKGLLGGNIESSSNDQPLQISVSALGSQNDRHTSTSTNSDIGDTAPSASSPYWGGSVQTTGSFGPHATGILGGEIIETRTTSAKVAQTNYFVGLQWQDVPVESKFKTGLLYSARINKYKGDDRDFSNVQSDSLEASMALQILDGRDLLAASRIGRGKRQSQLNLSESLKSSALQLEVGFRSWLSDGLNAAFMTTREWCRAEIESEDETGCFGNAIDGRNIWISRAALKVSYLIGGDI